MSRFLLTIFTILMLTAHLFAQSPTPTSPAATSSGRNPRISSESPGLPSPSPSATPTTQDLVNSLGPADLQAVITLLKSNFANPDATTDTELSRATVEGLMARLQRGVMLLPSKENAAAVPPSAFYSEIIAGHIAYVRLGSFNSANLQALDKSLSTLAPKKVKAV